MRLARELLEQHFPLLWIEGEISNFSRPASGHLYFTLKDAQAQIRCAMFKPKSTYLRFKPIDGMRVLARARAGLYEARGEFQLVIEHLEEAGEGALLRAFEQLKARLAAEGLFAAGRKRAVPRLPRRIGVITSPTGAAIRDVLHVIARRFPLVEVEILPVVVQGREAPGAIATMIAAASAARRHDVLLLTRGGGSLEDLWAFNDEAVARAIHASAIPIVSAIGHEVDFTIADFVADLRAPTPSAAAELLVPDSGELLRLAQHRHERLLQRMRHQLHRMAQQADHAYARLRAQHPRRRLRGGFERLAQLQARLRAQHPASKLARRRSDVSDKEQRLRACVRRRLESRTQHLSAVARALNAVNPLATLQRGYAILIDTGSGNVIRSASQASPGARLNARVAEGEFVVRVENTN